MNKRMTNLINNHFNLFNIIIKRYLKISNILKITQFKNIISIIIYILGSILYILSLKPINFKKIECYSKLGFHCYIFLGKLVFFSALITDLSILIIINNNYSKFHLLTIFIIYFILFIIDHNSGVIYHGFYNFIAFIFFLIIILIALLYIYYFLNLIQKKKYFSIFKYIIIFVFFKLNISFYKFNHFTCQNWAKGLNISTIDNISKDFPCAINIPKSKSCYLKEIGGYVDLSSKFRPTCHDDKLLKIEKEILFKNFENLKFAKESNMNHFGFPITNQNNNGDIFGTIIYNKKKVNFYHYINKNIYINGFI